MYVIHDEEVLMPRALLMKKKVGLKCLARKTKTGKVGLKCMTRQRVKVNDAIFQVPTTILRQCPARFETNPLKIATLVKKKKKGSSFF